MNWSAGAILAIAFGVPAPHAADAMFPDGLVHDFGQVPRGVQLRFAFRIVNTSMAPLRIVSVRSGGGGTYVVARPTKKVIQPREEVALEIFVDTRYFRGRKTVGVFVQTDDEATTVTRFLVTADSRGERDE